LICDSNALQDDGVASLMTGIIRHCSTIVCINLQCNDISSIKPFLGVVADGEGSPADIPPSFRTLDLRGNIDLSKRDIIALYKNYNNHIDDDNDDDDDDDHSNASEFNVLFKQHANEMVRLHVLIVEDLEKQMKVLTEENEALKEDLDTTSDELQDCQQQKFDLVQSKESVPSIRRSQG
jgi:hypothetical protein